MLANPPPRIHLPKSTDIDDAEPSLSQLRASKIRLLETLGPRLLPMKSPQLL